MKKGKKKTVIRPVRYSRRDDLLLRLKAAMMDVDISTYIRMKTGVEPIPPEKLVLYGLQMAKLMASRNLYYTKSFDA